MTEEQIERSLKAALLSPDGSPASLREFMASVSTLIHAIGPCHDMPHDDQVRIIAIITHALSCRAATTDRPVAACVATRRCGPVSSPLDGRRCRD